MLRKLYILLLLFVFFSIMGLFIIGGMISAELTLMQFPIFLWDHSGLLYMLTGLITFGWIAKAVTDWLDQGVKELRAEHEKNNIDRPDYSDSYFIVFLMAFFSSIFLWPAIWARAAYTKYEKTKKESL